MKVHGYTIHTSVFNATLHKLNPDRGINASSLALNLEEEGVPKVYGYKYVSITAAYRLIKKLKDQGLIKKIYGGGGTSVWAAINKTKPLKLKE
jgi:predicted Rossmann-fold nucleotide-binding protein